MSGTPTCGCMPLSWERLAAHGAGVRARQRMLTAEECPGLRDLDGCGGADGAGLLESCELRREWLRGWGEEERRMYEERLPQRKEVVL